MIIFIHGPDTYRSREYLKQSVNKFKATRDKNGYNVVVLDNKEIELGKLYAELWATPFLAEKRLVVIENILSKTDPETLEKVADWITKKTLPESTVAIFWQGEVIGKSKAAKDLQSLLLKEKYAQEFGLLKGAEFNSWVNKYLQGSGAFIKPDALANLAQNVGSDTWLLGSVLDELVAYTKAKEITLESVKLFVDEKLDDNVFTMVDAIVQGNSKKALQLLNYQRALGEEDGKIFGLLVWQYRILLQMADVLEREPGLTSDQIAKLIGLHPFVARKNIALVKRAPLATLQAAHNQLLEIDRKTKTGEAPQSMLIDMFVAQQ